MSRDYVQEKAREKADEHVRMCMKAGLRPSWESLFMAGYQEAADYENHIRLDRYDRAVELLQEIHGAANEDASDGNDSEIFWSAMDKIEAFLAEEPK